MWSSAFPTADIISAPAWGERRGGVALIIPQRYEINTSTILVEGCALAVSVTDLKNQDKFSVVVLYLPPDERKTVLNNLKTADLPEGRIYLGGDFNYDIRAPRDESEQEINNDFRQ